MDDRTKGYLEGLQAAALICQESAGDRNSHLSDKIMALHNKITLRGEKKTKLTINNFGMLYKRKNGQSNDDFIKSVRES